MAPQNRRRSPTAATGDDGFNSRGQYDPTYDRDSRYYIRGQNSDASEQARHDAERAADAQEAGGS
jgi:hypothetical protein